MSHLRTGQQALSLALLAISLCAFATTLVAALLGDADIAGRAFAAGVTFGLAALFTVPT